MVYAYRYKFINIQQSTKTGRTGFSNDFEYKFINIQQSTKTVVLLQAAGFQYKFINIQQSTKTGFKVFIAFCRISLSISNRVLKP